MITKHTPGPWVAEPTNIDEKTGLPYYYNIITEGYHNLAHVQENKFIGINHETMKYNAQLIAAAPEMLSALHTALRTLSSLKGTLMAHPDHEKGSEFWDRTDLVEKVEYEIKSLIDKATNI